MPRVFSMNNKFFFTHFSASYKCNKYAHSYLLHEPGNVTIKTENTRCPVYVNKPPTLSRSGIQIYIYIYTRKFPLTNVRFCARAVYHYLLKFINRDGFGPFHGGAIRPICNTMDSAMYLDGRYLLLSALRHL